MLGFRAPPPLNFKPLPPIFPIQNPNFQSLSTLRISQPQNPNQFRIFAQNDNNNNGIPVENGTENGDDKKVKNGRPRFNLRWADLVLDPNPDNIVAVGLTGLLTWASVQVLWQLFVVSAAILIAAVKYTIVAALLILIVITLL